MNCLPNDVIAEILTKSDHATKASAMFVNKTFFDVLETFDDLWTDAEFRRYDDTVVKFFQRHRVRALRLACTPEDATMFFRCDLRALRCLTLRFGCVDAPPDMGCVTLDKLERLDVTFGDVAMPSSFVVPDLPALRSIRVNEKGICACVDVVFDCTSPHLTDLDIRSRSCAVTVPDAKGLRRVCVVQDVPSAGDVDIDFRDADLEFLELDFDDSTDVSRANIQTLVVRVTGLMYFHAPFRTDTLRFAFSDADCVLNLHHDALKHAKAVSFASGMHHAPFVSWHASVENVPLADVGGVAAMVRLDDPRINFSFLNVAI